MRAHGIQFSVLCVRTRLLTGATAQFSIPIFLSSLTARCPTLVWCSVHRMLAPFPFLAQAPHGFAQAHCQCGNRFKPLFSAAWESAVILPVNFRQQELRVTQNSREGIVEFVTQHLSKIFLRLFEWFVGALSNLLRLPQAA